MIAVSAALSHWCLRKANGNLVTVTGVFRSPGIADTHGAAVFALQTLWLRNVRTPKCPIRLCFHVGCNGKRRKCRGQKLGYGLDKPLKLRCEFVVECLFPTCRPIDFGTSNLTLE